jgi:predicted Zn-dependent peptidase
LKAFEYEPVFKKTVLENGVRVLTEHHPLSRSVCAGIFVDLGTRDEPEDIVGAAHFVEHMVFKGTETRDAYEIAKSLEAVGGDLNAYTTREQTCFHATSLKEHLYLSLDVLSDLMSNAQFDSNDFKKEREVIIQEINMSIDDLDDYIFDLAFEASFRGNELSRSILGTQKTLSQTTRKKLFEFYNRRYQGENMIVCVAGHVDHEEVVSIISRTLRLKRRPFHTPQRKRPSFKPFVKAVHKPSEQTHVLIAFPSLSMRDKMRFESYIANAALGGGMTSRLYQKIREKQGLAYTVYSYLQPFSDVGLQMIYVGTSPKHIQKVMSEVLREVEHFYKKGLSKSELEFYKTQVIGALVLEADDIENRMNSLGYNEMTFKDYRTVDQTIADLEKVNVDSMNVFLKRYFDPSRLGAIVVGDVNEDRALSVIRKTTRQD